MESRNLNGVNSFMRLCYGCKRMDGEIGLTWDW